MGVRFEWALRSSEGGMGAARASRTIRSHQLVAMPPCFSSVPWTDKKSMCSSNQRAGPVMMRSSTMRMSSALPASLTRSLNDCPCSMARPTPQFLTNASSVFWPYRL